MRNAFRNWVVYLIDRISGKEPHIDRYVETPVLLAGCGDGERLSHGPGWLGLEKNFRNAKKAAQKGAVICGDVTRIPTREDSFRTVLALQLIEHLQPREVAEFLSDANRVLMPGGYLVVTSPLEPYVWNRLSHIRPYPPRAIETFIQTTRHKDTFSPPAGLTMDFSFFYGPPTLVGGLRLAFLSPITNLLANLISLGRSSYVAGFVHHGERDIAEDCE